jgi:serine protease AprX
MQNHTYSDMDGKTNISAIGASIASSKGIIVVNSAGNEGDDPWTRIGSPADADGILTVGAVDPEGEIAKFSSRGPSFDGRVKPDVCAQGVNTVVQNQSGEFTGANGTSLSSPLIAGLTACLWQANPDASNIQVMDAIRQSSSRYLNPDSLYGYGIPDFGRADRILKNMLTPQESPIMTYYFYPNPAKDFLNIEIYLRSETSQPIYITIQDITGRIIRESSFTTEGIYSFLNLNTEYLSSGIYMLGINEEGRLYSSVFIKIK